MDGAVVSIQTLLSTMPLTGVEPLAAKPNIKLLQLLLKYVMPLLAIFIALVWFSVAILVVVLLP